MIEYIELHVAHPINGLSGEMLVKKDSITVVEQTSDGRAVVRGVIVRESYQEVKDSFKYDPRRFVNDGTIDFRMQQLKSMTVMEIIKTYPGEAAVAFVKQLMECESWEEIYALEKEVEDNESA